MLLDLEWRKLKGLGELMRPLNACLDIKCVWTARFISRLLEVTEREHNKPLLSVKNSQELGSSSFPYIAPIIPRLLPREVVEGEYFVFADILKEVNLG